MNYISSPLAISMVAEWERDKISERTRGALRAAKARGKVLGNPNLISDNSERQAAAKARVEGLRTTLEGLKPRGLLSDRWSTSSTVPRCLPLAAEAGRSCKCSGCWHAWTRI